MLAATPSRNRDPLKVGGLTEACAERAETIYGMVWDHLVRIATLEAAELTKLLENIFRSVDIALVNELTMLTDRMGIVTIACKCLIR